MGSPPSITQWEKLACLRFNKDRKLLGSDLTPEQMHIFLIVTVVRLLVTGEAVVGFSIGTTVP